MADIGMEAFMTMTSVRGANAIRNVLRDRKLYLDTACTDHVFHIGMLAGSVNQRYLFPPKVFAGVGGYIESSVAADCKYIKDVYFSDEAPINAISYSKLRADGHVMSIDPADGSILATTDEFILKFVQDERKLYPLTQIFFITDTGEAREISSNFDSGPTKDPSYSQAMISQIDTLSSPVDLQIRGDGELSTLPLCESNIHVRVSQPVSYGSPGTDVDFPQSCSILSAKHKKFDSALRNNPASDCTSLDLSLDGSPAADHSYRDLDNDSGAYVTIGGARTDLHRILATSSHESESSAFHFALSSLCSFVYIERYQANNYAAVRGESTDNIFTGDPRLHNSVRQKIVATSSQLLAIKPLLVKPRHYLLGYR